MQITIDFVSQVPRPSPAEAGLGGSAHTNVMGGESKSRSFERKKL